MGSSPIGDLSYLEAIVSAESDRFVHSREIARYRLPASVVDLNYTVVISRPTEEQRWPKEQHDPSEFQTSQNIDASSSAFLLSWMMRFANARIKKTDRWLGWYGGP